MGLSSIGQQHTSAPVAQLDRVADYESAGHGFESCLARQKRNKGWPSHPFVYSGCSAAWLTRLLWEQKIAGSNPTIPTMNFGSIATAVLFQLNVKNMGGDLGGGFENFRPLVHRRTAIAGAVFRSIGFFKRMALEELGHALRLVGEHVAVVIENRALSVAQPLSDDS